MIGIVAAIIGTCSFVPQVIQIMKTKDTTSISLGMYAMFVTGIALWLIHGIRIQDIALILANGVTFVLASIILTYKIKYK